MGPFQTKLDLALCLTRMDKAPLTKHYHTVRCPMISELVLFRKSMGTVLFQSRSELGRCQKSTGRAPCRMNVELAPFLTIADTGLFLKKSVQDRCLLNMGKAPSMNCHRELFLTIEARELFLRSTDMGQSLTKLVWERCPMKLEQFRTSMDMELSMNCRKEPCPTIEARGQFLTSTDTGQFLTKLVRGRCPTRLEQSPTSMDMELSTNCRKEPCPTIEARGQFLKNMGKELSLTRSEPVQCLKRSEPAQYPKNMDMVPSTNCHRELFPTIEARELFLKSKGKGPCPRRSALEQYQTKSGLVPFLKNMDKAPSRNYHKMLCQTIERQARSLMNMGMARSQMRLAREQYLTKSELVPFLKNMDKAPSKNYHKVLYQTIEGQARSLMNMGMARSQMRLAREQYLTKSELVPFLKNMDKAPSKNYHKVLYQTIEGQALSLMNMDMARSQMRLVLVRCLKKSEPVQFLTSLDKVPSRNFRMVLDPLIEGKVPYLMNMGMGRFLTKRAPALCLMNLAQVPLMSDFRMALHWTTKALVLSLTNLEAPYLPVLILGQCLPVLKWVLCLLESPLGLSHV